MSGGIAAAVARLLGAAVVQVEPLHGGDLSLVSRVALADGRTVIAKGGALVAIEARMLAALAARGVPAPSVIGVDGDMLLMSALPGTGRLAGAAWDDLAAVLGRLHRDDAGDYGWDEDYAFGPVAIVNRRGDDWPAFWAEHRLRCHLPFLPAGLARRVEAVAARIGELLPARPRAALLHGDLWGGNVLVDGDRISGLIDPACYRGDREVDVAMLTLFDAPSPHVIEALALDAGWQARQPVYRLWPLLVHMRLFGGHYAASAQAALDAIGIDG